MLLAPNPMKIYIVNPLRRYYNTLYCIYNHRDNCMYNGKHYIGKCQDQPVSMVKAIDVGAYNSFNCTIAQSMNSDATEGSA